MTRPVSIKIDRLVLPASETARAGEFATRLKAGIASRIDPAAQSAPSSGTLADRTAAAVAQQVKAVKS